jgi:hypothetical protein
MDRAFGPVKHDTIEYSGLAVTDAAGHHLREGVRASSPRHSMTVATMNFCPTRCGARCA